MKESAMRHGITTAQVVTFRSPKEEDAKSAQSLETLHAAAPDLLAALKDALAFLDRPDIPPYEWYKLAPKHVGIFRRAIARAEGA